jgi:hypothetical protein
VGLLTNPLSLVRERKKRGGSDTSVRTFLTKVQTGLTGQWNELFGGAPGHAHTRSSHTALKRKQRHVSEDFSGSLIVSGDFRIDLSRRAVEIQGHNLKLSPAEFELLVFLTGHHQTVVTPNTMLLTRWSGKDVRQAEFVRVLLSLRKKVDLAIGSTTSYIRTEPWVFYRLDPGLAYAPKLG